MATLLEILATELKEWPEGANFAVQSSVRNTVYFEFDGFDTDKYDFSASDKAENHLAAKVTRSEWEAERARIANSIAPIADASKTSQSNEQKTQQHQGHDAISYEQRFWDDTVIAWTKGAASDPTTRSWQVKANEYAATAAAFADALMAERAKRLKARDA